MTFNFQKAFQVSIFKVVPLRWNTPTHSLDYVESSLRVALYAYLLVYQENAFQYIYIGDLSLVCCTYF